MENDTRNIGQKLWDVLIKPVKVRRNEGKMQKKGKKEEMCNKIKSKF